MKMNKAVRGLCVLGFVCCTFVSILALSFYVTASAPVIRTVGKFVIEERQPNISRDDMVASLLAIERTRSAVMNCMSPFNEASLSAVRLEGRAYDTRSLEHLGDVQAVISKAAPLAFGSFLGCLILGMLLFFNDCRCYLRKSLGLVGGCYLVAVAGLGTWALLDFDHLFTQFHALFFVDGTWLFSHDSLLITLFPEKFWMIAGSIWLVLICTVSVGLVAYSVLSRPKTVV